MSELDAPTLVLAHTRVEVNTEGDLVIRQVTPVDEPAARESRRVKHVRTSDDRGRLLTDLPVGDWQVTAI